MIWSSSSLTSTSIMSNSIIKMKSCRLHYSLTPLFHMNRVGESRELDVVSIEGLYTWVQAMGLPLLRCQTVQDSAQKNERALFLAFPLQFGNYEARELSPSLGTKTGVSFKPPRVVWGDIGFDCKLLHQCGTPGVKSLKFQSF